MSLDDRDSRGDSAGERPAEDGDGWPHPVVVGIGASAGALGALRQFFEHVPQDSGVAYVVVVHLSPEHESHLADLLQPHARIPVQQVTATLPLEPNRVYVIPPNANLNTMDSHLRLSELEERRRERAPIDHFFRTLSRTHDGHSIGVILTGTGSDGALGIKAIKERGGLAVVQDPNEAEYDGMPQSAIATGLVDVVLPLAEMPSTLIRFARTQPRVPVGDEDEEAEAGGEQRRLLQKVFAQLRAATGRDFTRYKSSTIQRRIARRMQLNVIEELPEYLELLRRRPEEVRHLADDLLITVTSFFRDPEVFEILAADVVPRLFEGKHDNDVVRLWSVGCATGEEAYSLAILLLEEAARRNPSPRIQVFASDLHERSLERAREGFYPGDIETEVSPERLRRYFRREDGRYRMRKEVRELVVFAPHNLLADPPFSRIDLVSCRNLLIYLQRDVQREVMELFHYALQPEGYLLLGSAETVEEADLFRTEDKKLCLYRKRDVTAREPRLPVFPVTRQASPGEEIEATERTREPLAYGRLHQRMVERYAPPSLLVSPDDKVVHLSEHAGRYLLPPGGEPTMSVYKLVREELRLELRAGLHAARTERAPQRSRPLEVRFDGSCRPVVLDVRPALEPRQEGFALVIFDEREPSHELPAPSGGGGDATADRDAARVREVEAELEMSRQRLQGIIEEYETSQEELRASNEELQSANEELRSTMEELETSKEELQSMNEELQTVNQENRHKVEELAQLSGDLQNLLAATDIATLFLDRSFRIMRFTPKVSDVFNVRTTDRGRPISDLTHRLGYPELQEDAEAVLRKLVPIEREIEDEAGRWYLTRVLPYRSTVDRIDGVVITLVDITARKQAGEELRELAETLEERVEARSREARELASRLTIAEQEERRRISHVLHDEVQQLVHGVETKLATIRRQLGDAERPELVAALDEARGWLDRVQDTTHQLTLELSPPVLREGGLVIGLEWLQRQMAEMHGLEVDLDVVRDGAELEEGDRLILFLAVRELLFNVKKHAEIGRASVRLDQEDDHLVLGVSDLGVGFDPEEVSTRKGHAGGFGLASIRERLRLLGGRLEIVSRRGGGTRVEVHAPVVPASGD